MVQFGYDIQASQAHAWRNRLHSAVLLAVMGGFLALLGWMIWGLAGIAMLLGAGLGSLLFIPGAQPTMVMRLYGARPLAPRQAPMLFRALGLLSERAGLPAVPQLFYIPSRTANAFAVGNRDNAAIGLSDGLMRQLNLRELSAVLAHEISHVRYNDLWVMGLADLISRLTRLLSLFGQFLLLLSLPAFLFYEVLVNWFAILLLILAPSLSALAQLALSRTREFEADRGAAELTGDPEALISALIRIERSQGGWLEQIFLPGRRLPDPSLLRTHPDTADRIARLREFAPRQRLQPLAVRLENPLAMLPLRMGRPARPHWHLNGLWY